MRPDKPTRDRATETREPGRLYDKHAGEDSLAGKHPEARSREEKGGAASSRRHAPHPTGQEGGAPADGDAPVLPANAQGTDTVPTDEAAQPIQEGSMYDQRPEEDKDRPASTRGD